MTKPIKPGLDRRVAKNVRSAIEQFIDNSYTIDEMDIGIAHAAIRAIARELPPTQAARLLKAAGIERQRKR